MNRVILSGYIGQDCEVKTFDGGGKAVSATIATSFQKKVGDKYEDATDWHNLKVTNHKANFAEIIFKRGAHVTIEGKLKHREYTDKSGNKKYFTEVSVDDFTPSPKVKSEGQQPQAAPAQVSQGTDDLPF